MAPQIHDLLKVRKIHYSAIQTAHFVTHSKDKKDSLSPIIIWIATHPTTTTAETAHNTSLDILTLLKVNGVKGIMVEGIIEKLSGPPLLHVTVDTNHVCHFLTAGLGMPITAAERKLDGAEGSVSFFFRKNKDRYCTNMTKCSVMCHIAL